MVDIRSAFLALLAGLSLLNSIPGAQDEWQFRIRRPAEKAQQGVDAVPGAPPASVSSQTVQQPAEKTAEKPAAKPDEYYVVMYSATWCGPCQGWKRNELPKLRAAGVPVTVVDCDKEPQWNRARRATDSVTGKTVVIPGVSAYPTFAIVRKSDRFPVANIVGPVPAAGLIARIPKPAATPAAEPTAVPPAPDPPLSMKWNIQGDWTPTVQQTAAHMLEDHGISVDGLTHQQMLKMHDLLHDAAGK